MKLKSRIDDLETKAGVGREVIDIFVIGVPWPDPGGHIKAAGYQRIAYGLGVTDKQLEWFRREGETEEEFVARAKREAPVAGSNAYARSFSVSYRDTDTSLAACGTVRDTA